MMLCGCSCDFSQVVSSLRQYSSWWVMNTGSLVFVRPRLWQWVYHGRFLSFARQNALVGSITRVVGVLGLAGMILRGANFLCDETSSPVAVLILSLFILRFLFESCFDTAASLFRGTSGLVVLPVFDQLRVLLLVFSHTEHHETLILRR